MTRKQVVATLLKQEEANVAVVANLHAALDKQTERIVQLNKLITQLQEDRNKAMEFVNGTRVEMDRLTKTNKRLQYIVDLYIAGKLWQ